MDKELLQAILDIVFKGNLLYLSPVLLLLMAVTFSDRIIQLIYDSIGEKSHRRNRY